MPLETNPQFINELDASWPTGQDTEGHGDDHFRNIKRVLKNTFPNINGAVLATQAELNILDEKTEGAALPAGTVTVFHQNTAPVGWTRVTTYHDRGLRLIGTGSVSSPGGRTFSSVFSSSYPTSQDALSVSQLPSHNHSINDPGHAHVVQLPAEGALCKQGGGGNSWDGGGNQATIQTTASAAAAGTNVSINNTGSGAAHGHTVNLDMMYVDFIVASKD